MNKEKEHVVIVPNWLYTILKFFKLARYPLSKRHCIVQDYKVYHPGHGQIWVKHTLKCEDNLADIIYHTTYKWPIGTKCMITVQPLEECDL